MTPDAPPDFNYLLLKPRVRFHQPEPWATLASIYDPSDLPSELETIAGGGLCNLS